MKECNKCGETKPAEEFNHQHRQCKDCYATKRRNARYLSRYGMTLEEYDVMERAQDFKCAICRTETPGGRRSRFSVDHNHDTGEVRGLLCYGCNVGLGNFGDDVGLLQEAIQYLQQRGSYGKSGHQTAGLAEGDAGRSS